MAIEGGARCGYVNPDSTTFKYLKNRQYSPKEEEWEQAMDQGIQALSDDRLDHARPGAGSGADQKRVPSGSAAPGPGGGPQPDL